MPSHTLHHEKKTFYFITLTCFKWLNLFEASRIYDYLPLWFKKLKDKDAHLCGYVIMPNHLHLIIYLDDCAEHLNKLISESKRFMAYEMVKRLKINKHFNLLNTLKNGVQENEKSKGKKHQVFRLSFDAKPIDEAQVAKILDYIHHNPVSKKWCLVNEYTQYPYSSADFYENGGEPKFGLIDYRDVIELLESNKAES